MREIDLETFYTGLIGAIRLEGMSEFHDRGLYMAFESAIGPLRDEEGFPDIDGESLYGVHLGAEQFIRFGICTGFLVGMFQWSVLKIRLDSKSATHVFEEVPEEWRDRTKQAAERFCNVIYGSYETEVTSD